MPFTGSSPGLRIRAEAGEYRETGDSGRGCPESPVHEAHELEFASRLLEVSDEQELEQFLGDVFRAAGSAVGRFARSETGLALGGILKTRSAGPCR